MTDTRKEFEEEVHNLLDMARDYGASGMSTDFDIGEAIDRIYAACQSLNDKRIQQLLSVIAKKDEALKLSAAVFSGEISDKSGMIKSLEILRDSLAIKPENVELVESK